MICNFHYHVINFSYMFMHSHTLSHACLNTPTEDLSKYCITNSLKSFQEKIQCSKTILLNTGIYDFVSNTIRMQTCANMIFHLTLSEVYLNTYTDDLAC